MHYIFSPCFSASSGSSRQIKSTSQKALKPKHIVQTIKTKSKYTYRKTIKTRQGGEITQRMPGKTKKSSPIGRWQPKWTGKKVPEFWCHDQEGPFLSCHPSTLRNRASKEDWYELVGSYGRRWSFRYAGPQMQRDLKVNTNTLNWA